MLTEVDQSWLVLYLIVYVLNYISIQGSIGNDIFFRDQGLVTSIETQALNFYCQITLKTF
jgi:hypothetical protein